jgi:hypothetical protein
MRKPSDSEVLAAFDTLIIREAEHVEQRISRLARKTCVNRDLLMDALTIELTGRFIGRKRDELTENKLLPGQVIQ